MIEDAFDRSGSLKVNRTTTSQFDTVYGILGEYCFAQWYLGDWKFHRNVNTKGQVDFFGLVEIKTSAFPFSEKLNLLVREDYAEKRKPNFYVQTIINLPDRWHTKIEDGMECILTGFETSANLEKAPLRDFGSKFGGHGGYRCRYIPISHLRPMDELKIYLDELDLHG